MLFVKDSKMKIIFCQKSENDLYILCKKSSFIKFQCVEYTISKKKFF